MSRSWGAFIFLIVLLRSFTTTIPLYVQQSLIIGVNISERKSGTKRTKKRKKREFVFFSTARGRTGTVVHHLDATPILPELR